MGRKAQPVDQLLTSLRNVGERSEGEFTLDPRLAAEKLREAQLANPYDYVLLLVEAAVAGGCTFVDARLGSRETTLYYDGPVPPPADLESLFARLFTRRVQPGLRALGLGLNAALRLTQDVRVEAWDGQRAHTLTVTAAGSRLEPCAWTAPAGASWKVCVKHRVGWQTLKNLVGSRPPEAEALTRGCRYAPVPVKVNERPANRDLDSEGALLWAHLVGGEPVTRLQGLPADDVLVRLELPSKGDFEAILVGRLGQPRASQVTLVVNGVEAGRRSLANGHLELAGVVACTRLQRNMSRSDLVNDGVLEKLLGRLKRQARDLLTASLVALRERPIPPELESRLLSLVAEHVRPTSDKPPNPLQQALLELPLMPLHDGQKVSVRALLGQYSERGTLLMTYREPAAGQNLEGVQVVSAAKSPVLRAIQRVFPHRENAEDLLDGRLASEAGHTLFLQRPEGPRDLPSPAVVRLGLKQGEVGLSPHPAEPWCLLLGREGRLLGPWRGPRTELPAGVQGVLYHDALLPTPEWDGALPCPARQEVLSTVRNALPELYRRLASQPEWPVEHLLNALEYIVRGGTLALPEEILAFPWLASLGGQLLSLHDVGPRNAWVSPDGEIPASCPHPTFVLEPRQLRVLRGLYGKAAWVSA